MQSSDHEDEERPLEALLTAEEDDRPDTLSLGDTEIDADTFCSRLSVIQGVAMKLEVLQEDLEALRRTRLRDEDVVDLLYGRNSQLTKTQIRAVMEAVDDIDRRLDSASAREDLLVRITSDVSDETMADTRDVFEDLGRLNRRYGGDDE
ncbi:MAG: hypothetical protein ABEI98_10715 [Halorhabdus sp.]